MENVQKLKWWYFGQNNSGGYFDVDEDVSEYVYIQAASAKEAEKKMEEITLTHSGSCECCGDRWYIDADEEEGTDVPARYGRFPPEATSHFVKSPNRFHYYDGRVTKEYV